MGELVNFCAGTNAGILPAKETNSILVNVPHDGSDDRAINATNRMLDYARSEHRFLDTGGYQYSVAEKEGKKILCDSSKPVECSPEVLNLTVEHAVYAMANMNITMANALDFPIKEKGTPGENDFEFLKKLGCNLAWGIRSLEFRNENCPDVELFLPVQCYDLEQFDYFRKLLGPVKFDGYSIPPRNYSIAELALFLVKFDQLGMKKVHLLGTSTFFIIALAAYMARHYFDWVSLDATTWRKAAENGSYLNQHDLVVEKIYNVFIDERIVNDCSCPFCKNTTFTYIKNLPQTERVNFLRCHNFWVIDQAAKDLYDNAGTIPDLEKYLRRKSNDIKKIEELLRVLSLIDLLKDKDIKEIQTFLL
jgi:queuine/archaeosine tRNA-ribosyltransferase